MLCAGIDIGSLTAKAVILKDDQVVGDSVRLTGIDIPFVAEKVLEESLKAAQMQRDQIFKIVGTGYGRISIPFADKQITEITCNAAGAHFLVPGCGTVIDVGGQDSKVIKIRENGKVETFLMNDKCAAGTGKFLQIAADTLGMSLEEISNKDTGKYPVAKISNTCAVFAQTEIVSLIARQIPVPRIINGLIDSIVDRLVALINSINPDPQKPFVMTGGVAKNKKVVDLLKCKIGRDISVPEKPQIVTALGAAILAKTQ